MKKLYYVTVTFEAEDTLPVMAESEAEAREIAGQNIDEDDLDCFDKTFSAWQARSKLGFSDVRPYGQDKDDARTCEEIIMDQEKEKKRLEADALEPKLPGFES